MGPREREIRKTADDVLAELNITATPILPEDIARAKNIHLEERGGFPKDVYGALYQDSAGFGILVSAQCHTPGHRSFTIAHELGHYHIDGHVEAMFPGGVGQVPSLAGHFRSQKTPHEREADWFAAELLCPTAIILPRVRDLCASLQGIEAIARDFGVSLPCAGVRYTEMTDEAAAIVLARGREIEWIAFSGRLHEHRWTRNAWKKEWVPSGSATARLADRPDQVEARERSSSTSLLCEWFEGAPEGLAADEECLGLGQYGRTMTVLSVPDLPSVDDEEEERQEDTWRERDWRDAMRPWSLD